MDTMKKDKSKTYMIVGIIILVLALIGSTYAYYRYVFANVNVDTITRGLDYYITYAKGTDITNKVLEPSTDYTGGNSVTVTLYKKDNTYDIYGHIYLNVTSIGTALSNSSALRYVVTDGTNIVTKGDLKGVTASSKIPLAVNIPLNTTSTEYTVYLWFNDNISEETSSEGQTISASVSCEASMKKINDINYSNTAAYRISKLYANSTKTPVSLNSVTYQYDTTNNLMEDTAGNIRYYGANPNNYIYFNCSDYNNQSSSTCETWRIIGVFDGKVKIMRGSVIGTYSWDSSASGTNDGKGVNEWSQADLMKLLNSGYDSESVGGSLYWNAKSGTCYNGQNNAKGSCNFTSTGLKNDTTRNLIAETTYYTRGHNSSSIYVDAMYDKERVSGTVITGVTPTRKLTWTGKVAIPYPSDYGYAADFSLCQKKLNSYSDAACTANNWMKSIITNNGSDFGWLLTPTSGGAGYAWGVSSSGNVYGYDAYSAYGVAPVLSLTSELDIGSGTGESSSPYQLSV